MAKEMQVGESRNEGVVVYTRFHNYFLVECSMCGWRKEYPNQATVEWLAFTHNRGFRKDGCSKAPEGTDMHEDFIIQGLMSGILICEELSVTEEGSARIVAKGMLNRKDFEGDSVRIITRDGGELVWDSNNEKVS